MKKNLLSIVAMAMLMVISAVGYAQTTYTKISSAAELVPGEQYIIVGFDETLGFCAMSYQKTSNRHAVQVIENGGSISVTPATDPNSQTEVFQFTLDGSNGAWTFYDELKGGYLYAASSSNNQLKTQTTLDDNGKWAIEFDADGNATVVAQGENTRNYMRFNENSSNGDPLFNCYKVDGNIQVPVAFYKAGGTPTVYPEPSNYPTNFAATVEGLDITLTWTEVGGEQLPSKYLVVASTGNITVPTDGTPVANDNLHQNVNVGAERVTFSGLQSNTTYHFAIFPYTNSGANIDYKTDGSYPTANATTQNVYYWVNENFSDGLGVFTAVNITGEQEWHQASYQGTTYANMNGYANSTYNENEDWLISPAIEVSAGAWSEMSFEFRSAMKFDGNPLTVWYSTEYDGGGNPNDFNWTNISDAFDFSTGNYTWVESGRLVMANPAQATYYFAFVYTSTDQAASSWEITDVKVMGTGMVSVKENSIQNVSVYPNPAHDMVSFNLKADAKVSVYDVTGRMVSTMNVAAGQGQYQVAGLENGVYFLNIRYNDGKTEVARFVKF